MIEKSNLSVDLFLHSYLSDLSLILVKNKTVGSLEQESWTLKNWRRKELRFSTTGSSLNDLRPPTIFFILSWSGERPYTLNTILNSRVILYNCRKENFLVLFLLSISSFDVNLTRQRDTRCPETVLPHTLCHPMLLPFPMASNIPTSKGRNVMIPLLLLPVADISHYHDPGQLFTQSKIPRKT